MNQEDELQEQLKLQQQISNLENVVKHYLTKDAIQRYGNLKAAHPKKALSIIMLIAQLIQNGQLSDKIDDQTFKDFLLKTQEQKKEFRFLSK